MNQKVFFWFLLSFRKFDQIKVVQRFHKLQFIKYRGILYIQILEASSVGCARPRLQSSDSANFPNLQKYQICILVCIF